MHLWARFGLLATNWRLARIPVDLDRDSKTSTRKGLLLSSPACRYILAVSCQPLFTDGEQMMVFPKVQKHTSFLKTDWGTTTIGLRNQREQETDLIWKATQEAARGPVTLGLDFLVAQVKSPPAMQETRVWSLGREDPLGEEMATHSNIPAVLQVISVSTASLKPSHSASLWFLPGEPRTSARGKPGSQAEQRPWWVDTGAQHGMEKLSSWQYHWAFSQDHVLTQQFVKHVNKYNARLLFKMAQHLTSARLFADLS